MARGYDLPADVKEKIDEFNDADAHFKQILSEFEQDHATELAYLERLRLDRNAKLDDAVRVLRAEAERVPHTTTKRLSYGPFVAQKRTMDFYNYARFVSIAEDLDLMDQLIDLGILKEELVMPLKFEDAKARLVEQGLADYFEEAEDIREASAPAITRPGPVTALGTETKEK